MIKVRKEWDNFLILKNLCFGKDEWFQENYINLSEVLWTEIKYWIQKIKIIDYPWEYEMSNIFFKVYLGNDNKLNYIIRKDNIVIAIIQSVNILESKNFEKINYWIFKDNKFSDMLDKLELEWEKINLNENNE